MGTIPFSQIFRFLKVFWPETMFPVPKTVSALLLLVLSLGCARAASVDLENQRSSGNLFPTTETTPRFQKGETVYVHCLDKTWAKGIVTKVLEECTVTYYICPYDHVRDLLKATHSAEIKSATEYHKLVMERLSNTIKRRNYLRGKTLRNNAEKKIQRESAKLQ